MLLRSELLEDEKIRKAMNDTRYYFSSDLKDFLLGGFCDDIFVEIKKEKSISFEILKSKICHKIDLIKKETKIADFDLYYAINLEKINQKINEISFRDIRINILNYDDIKNTLENTSLNDNFLPADNFNKSEYQYIKVSIKGRNKEYAEQKATKYVELILGFISFSIIDGVESISWTTPPKSLIGLGESYIFVFKSEKYDGYFYFSERFINAQSYSIEERDVDNLNLFLSHFNNANDEVQETICQAVSQYYFGLKEKKVHYAFLNFWIAFEILTLKEKSSPQYGIIEILKSTIKLDSLDEYKIKRLYDLRNEFIHNGNFDIINEIDRNLMRTYLEHFIKYFILCLSEYKVSDLRIIYRFLPKDKQYLQNAEEMIEKVIRLK